MKTNSSLRCPCCGSSRISDATMCTTTEGSRRLTFGSRSKPVGQALGGLITLPNTVHFEPERARVCSGCGHVMSFLDDRQLQQFAESFDDLYGV